MTLSIFFFTFQIPRILYPGLVHRGQEADVPVLPREGGPEADVPQPVGEAAHHVRPASGLAEVANVLATYHPDAGAGYQLGTRPRIAMSHTRIFHGPKNEVFPQLSLCYKDVKKGKFELLENLFLLKGWFTRLQRARAAEC
jgi:hypothetical protein